MVFILGWIKLFYIFWKLFRNREIRRLYDLNYKDMILLNLVLFIIFLNIRIKGYFLKLNSGISGV